MGTLPVRRCRGRYTSCQRLDSDGPFERYVAYDPSNEKTVVLKTAFLNGDPLLEQEYREQAAMLEGLFHPNLARTLEHWIEGDTFFLVLENVEGVPLSEYLKGLSKIPMRDRISRLIRIFEGVAWALDALHSAGVTLGRIAPSEILIEPSGMARLSFDSFSSAEKNFGRVKRNVARPLTAAGLSPEERRGETADAMSDLFALGSVMYDAFSGHPPASDSRGVLPPSVLNPEIPKALDVLILKAMEQDRSKRLRLARELALRLRAIP